MLIIQFLFSLSLIHVAGSDPCEDFDSFKTRDDGLACIRNVPFDQPVFQDMIDSYIGDLHLTEFQVFKDISKYSGYPYYINVDLDAEFQNLDGAIFSNWYDSVDAIWKVWSKLKDVHTKYYIAPMFGSFTSIHPISVFPTFDPITKTLIYSINHNNITETIFEDYNDVYGTNYNFSDYDGWIINKMNGLTPDEYMKELSRTDVNFNRDIGANFNQLVIQDIHAGMGGYTYYCRIRRDMPIPEEAVTYEIQNPTNSSDTLVLPDIDFLTCFHNGTHCIPIPDSTYVEDAVLPDRRRNVDQQEFPKFTFPPNPPEYFKEKSHQREDHNNLQKFTALRRDIESNDKYTLICYDEEYYSPCFAAYIRIDDPSVGVFVVFGEGNYEDDGNVYATEALRCVKEMVDAGAEKMILDLRLNTGGMPRLSFLISAAISKKTFVDAGKIQTPIVSSKPVYDDLTSDEPVFFGEEIQDLLGMEFFEDHPDHEMVLPNGEISTLGPIYIMNLEDRFDWSKEEIIMETEFDGFEPEDIMVLASGAAISAGGEFLRFMQFTRSGKIGVIGGFPDIPLDGGCVYSGLTGGMLLNSYHFMQVSWASVFPLNPEYSVYDKSKVDYSQLYEVTMRSDPDFRYYTYQDIGVINPISDELFDQIKVDIFENCVLWNIRVNDSCEIIVENGVYGNPCVNGEYDVDFCVLKRCDNGYYLNEVKSECLDISEAPNLQIWEDSFEDHSCPDCPDCPDDHDDDVDDDVDDDIVDDSALGRFSGILFVFLFFV